MASTSVSQAQGQLVSAVSVGGIEALWRLAQHTGPVGELARHALDKLTLPDSNLSTLEAVNLIINQSNDSPNK